MELEHLKNLGSTSINWLRAIGITTAEELKDIGPIEAYIRVKEQDIKVSKVFLYAMYAALKDISWTELSNQQKQQLLEQVDCRIANEEYV